jgi:hypothetical protein
VNCVTQKPNFVHDNGNWGVTQQISGTFQVAYSKAKAKKKTQGMKHAPVFIHCKLEKYQTNTLL